MSHFVYNNVGIFGIIYPTFAKNQMGGVVVKHVFRLVFIV